MTQSSRQIPSILIRPATPSDAEALAAMITLLAAHHGDKAATDADRVRDDLFSSSPWAIAIVAEVAGDIQGYALLIRLYRAQFAKRVMDLHHLFVSPSARQAGIGTALVDAAIREAVAQGCKQISVGTHPENRRAQSFYRRFGFAVSASAHGVKFKLDLNRATASDQGG